MNRKLSPILKELIGERGGTCISLIIPQHQTRSHKKEDDLAIAHTIAKLEKLLAGNYDASLTAKLKEKLSSVRASIEPGNGTLGIGLFMSENVFHTIGFYYEVKEKVQVGESFEIRDVLYNELRMQEYFVLTMEKDRYRLFSAQGPRRFEEIRNTDFPILFNEYEYSIPVKEEQPQNMSSAVKTMVKTENHNEFYNILNTKLRKYPDKHCPLIIAGVTSELADFENTTDLTDSIKGRVTGSYEDYNLNDLKERSWHAIEQWQKQEDQMLIARLKELTGRELVSPGIQNAWRDAWAGKGETLVIEKDFVQPGFVAKDEYLLWLKPPVFEHRIISDAADDLIEMVLAKNGTVRFVENGELEEFGHIALINRYAGESGTA